MAPVTLAQAKLNTTDDLDLMVIDEFRKSSFLLDSLTFDDCVNPAGGGATLTYTYTRLATERAAAFRPFNTEYAEGAATRARVSVDLAPLGGAFSVDRVLGNLGPASSNEVAFQMGQVIKSTRAYFADQVINGATTGSGETATGFDGLSVALTGSATEYTEAADWSALPSDAEARQIIANMWEWLALMDEQPGAILGNRLTIARLKGAALAAGFHERRRDEFGQAIDTFAGIPLVDLGAKAGSNDPVIAVDSEGKSDLYAVRFGLDGFHAVGINGAPVVRQWMPDFTTSGAVKRGEVELGPVAVALKATKAAAVWRGIQVQPVPSP
ncbi:major capsid protein [Saccharopolyspora sp. 6V]|uniref:major capsid protein n=1 Tax=Saccharopolyspora sp. 6V TaxID=2877239 RepID=UPI001CD3FD6F|nr:hypothetical protein [Saccharopolyspora sp. 6V]MCA1195128.1 hypothetical protein [Saccharopolyspora sp. 6V]